MSPNGAQIFISYARADAQFVDRVVGAVEILGYQPWIDRQQLAGSQQWSQELQRAIAASRAFIIVLTPASIASPTVAQEYRYALASGIPVIVMRTQKSLAIPAELAQCPLIDNARWHYYTSRLYVVCRDLRLPTLPPIAGFNSRTAGALYLALEGQIAPNWWAYRTPTSALIVRAMAYLAVSLAMWGALLRPSSPPVPHPCYPSPFS